MKDRLLHLEEAVSTKAQVEAALNNCNQWIAETRSEFKVLTGPIGIGEGDAHVMLHKCQVNTHSDDIFVNIARFVQVFESLESAWNSSLLFQGLEILKKQYFLS